MSPAGTIMATIVRTTNEIRTIIPVWMTADAQKNVWNINLPIVKWIKSYETAIERTAFATNDKEVAWNVSPMVLKW